MHRQSPQLVSIVIAARNEEKYIGEQIRALTKQEDPGVPFDVILVDNGSTDRSASVALQAAGDLSIRVVYCPQPGVGYARNLGVDESTGELILFCDADDVADTQWVRKMLDAATKLDVVGGKRDWAFLNTPNQLLWRGEPHGEGLPIAMGVLPYATGANVGIWRDVLTDLGGWDESLSYGGEDVDLSWRAIWHGYELGYAPDAIIYYRLRGSFRDTLQQLRAYARSGVFVVYKHGIPLPDALTLNGLFRRLIWLLIRVPYLAIGGRRRIIWMRSAAFWLGRVEGRLRAAGRAPIPGRE